MNLKSTFITTALLLGASLTSGSQVLTVRTDKPGAEVQPTMYGLFLKTSTMPLTADFTPKWSKTAPSNSRSH